MRAWQYLLSTPPLRRWRRRRFVDWFLSERGYTAHCGIFASFAEARTWLPPTREYDQKELTQHYVDVVMHRISTYDYPVLWWLNHAFSRGATRILDIGGSVGVHYHAYRKYLAYPPGLTWRVFELPAVAAVARDVAARTGAAALEFTDSLDPAGSTFDVWLSSGAIHYMESAQPDALLAACPPDRRPRHILLNKVPLYDGPTFVTAQNIGNGSFSPAYIYNRDEFVGGIESRGYVLVDRWLTAERSCRLFDCPERSFDAFSGLYFAAR